MDNKISRKIEPSPFNLEHQQTEIESKIVVGFERIAEIFRVLLWNQAKGLKLSPVQIQILIFLQHHDLTKSNVSYLSKEFNLSKPTISDSVAVLEKKELIEKIKSVKDTRSFSIRLTKAGEELVLQTENFANPLKQIISEMAESEQDFFWKILSRIIFKSNQDGIISVQRMCFNCKFYRQNNQTGFCSLLGKSLKSKDIRIDCPEFVDAVNDYEM
jgi:DNA-binding MarR family transcriptional regulator